MAKGDSPSIRGRIATGRAAQTPGSTVQRSGNTTRVLSKDGRVLAEYTHTPDWIDRNVGPAVKPVAMAIMAAAGAKGLSSGFGAGSGGVTQAGVPAMDPGAVLPGATLPTGAAGTAATAAGTAGNIMGRTVKLPVIGNVSWGDLAKGALAAYQGYQGARANQRAGQLSDEALKIARERYAAGAPLRERGMEGLLNPAIPDLSGVMADPSNPFARRPAAPPATTTALPTRRRLRFSMSGG